MFPFLYGAPVYQQVIAYPSRIHVWRTVCDTTPVEAGPLPYRPEPFFIILPVTYRVLCFVGCEDCLRAAVILLEAFDGPVDELSMSESVRVLIASTTSFCLHSFTTSADL